MSELVQAPAAFQFIAHWTIMFRFFFFFLLSCRYHSTWGTNTALDSQEDVFQISPAAEWHILTAWGSLVIGATRYRNEADMYFIQKHEGCNADNAEKVFFFVCFPFFFYYYYCFRCSHIIANISFCCRSSWSWQNCLTLTWGLWPKALSGGKSVIIPKKYMLHYCLVIVIMIIIITIITMK